MTSRQKKIARRRRAERRRKINKVFGYIENGFKFIGWVITTAAFLVVFVANAEANPDRTILLLEITASFSFALWLYWRIFIKNKEEKHEHDETGNFHFWR